MADRQRLRFRAPQTLTNDHRICGMTRFGGFQPVRHGAIGGEAADPRGVDNAIGVPRHRFKDRPLPRRAGPSRRPNSSLKIGGPVMMPSVNLMQVGERIIGSNQTGRPIRVLGGLDRRREVRADHNHDQMTVRREMEIATLRLRTQMSLGRAYATLPRALDGFTDSGLTADLRLPAVPCRMSRSAATQG
jgi:hypothetical protein